MHLFTVCLVKIHDRDGLATVVGASDPFVNKSNPHPICHEADCNPPKTHRSSAITSAAVVPTTMPSATVFISSR
ncbi:hypothetical protein J1614_006658 [Plenodomus biglobosus]|nr:hypothetical protein J1614_006658 [Plenodomus biglobosus]